MEQDERRRIQLAVEAEVWAGICGCWNYKKVCFYIPTIITYPPLLHSEEQRKIEEFAENKRKMMCYGHDSPSPPSPLPPSPPSPLYEKCSAFRNANHPLVKSTK